MYDYDTDTLKLTPTAKRVNTVRVLEVVETVLRTDDENGKTTVVRQYWDTNGVLLAERITESSLPF